MTESRKKRAFDTDLAAGNIPDMVIMGTASPMFDTFIESYKYSGLLADMTPLMAADADFHYDGLLRYITKPFQTEDGAQLLFPLFPRQQLWFGHAEDFGTGGGLTYDAFLSAAETFKADDIALTGNNQTAWSIASAAAVHEMYSVKDAVCRFDDGTLLSLYTRAKAIRFPDTALNTDAAEEDLFRMGEIALYHSQIGFNSLYSYAELIAALGGDAVPVGYPTADGTMCMKLLPGTYFAVTQTSKEQAACIDFLQVLIDLHRAEVNDGDLGGAGYTYYREDIEMQLSAFEGKTVIINGRSSYILDDADAVGEPGLHIKLTREDADAFTAHLDGIERCVDDNTQPATIFWEVFYAAGDKPFEELLKLVQSKVSIYLSEQHG